MSDTLADLIARAVDENLPGPNGETPERLSRPYTIADAILTALGEAGYTIVKRDGWQTVGHLAPGTELKITRSRRCPSVLRISGAQCDLDEGHDGWHRHDGNNNAATWADKPTDWFAVKLADRKEDQ